MTSSYPLQFFDDRDLGVEYKGRILIWDIDLTYLNTPLSSIFGMAKSLFEFPIDKISIKGSAEVLRGLRRGGGGYVECVPLYFVSASPSVLLPILKRKMQLDGVEFDGLILKDWGAVLLALKPARLFHQIGFKLCSLLTLKLKYPLAENVLFGDDFDDDPVAYSIFSAIVNDKLSAWSLQNILSKLKVESYDQKAIFHLAEVMPKQLGKVSGIYIRKIRTQPSKTDFESIFATILKAEGISMEPCFFTDYHELAKHLSKQGLVDKSCALY